MAAELDAPMLSDALVILGSAGIVIPVFHRFRITPVIGFILIGIAVGPFGLGKLVFGLGALELLLTGSLLAIFLMMLGQYWTGALGLGLALALSSTAIVLPISGTTSPVGRAALSMLLFEDIAIVPIIFMLGAMAPYAGEAGWAGLLDTLWKGALVVVALLVIGRIALPRLFAQAARTKSPELFLAASLLVVIGASLATAIVGLSPIVGALIAGLLIAETEYSREVEGIMEPFKGLALGVFLITVGMSIDLATIWANLWSLTIAVVGVLTFKACVTGILLRMMGARRSTAAETGVLMASPSETTLIVLSAASAALLIQPGTAQFWQIVTAIGLTITPLLARLGRVIARQVDPVPEMAVEDRGVPRVIIVGAGRVGRLVADMLDVHGKPYVAIDSDADLIARAKRKGYHATFGDAAHGHALERLGIDHALAVILTMDEPVLAHRLAAKLRKAHPDLPIISRARDLAHAADLYRAGASHAVPETLESSLQLSEALLVDLGVAMGPVIASIHEKRDEFRTQIQREAKLEHKPKLRTSTSATDG